MYRMYRMYRTMGTAHRRPSFAWPLASVRTGWKHRRWGPDHDRTQELSRTAASRAVCAALLCAGLAPAQAGEAPAQAAYVGCVLGLHAFDLTLGVSLQPDGYHVAASFRLAGMFGALWPAEGSTVVEGRFSNGRPVPRDMVSHGRYWGTTHSLHVDWKDGLPEVVQMIPPAEQDRDKVPVRDQANTVDTMSAIAALMQEVAARNRCDLTARTYDGSRLSELSARTVGQEMLTPTDRSSFHGAALRCELTGRMIGGFLRHDHSADARRPKMATIWFARVRGEGPPIPVRMAFSQQGSPGAAAYLAK